MDHERREGFAAGLPCVVLTIGDFFFADFTEAFAVLVLDAELTRLFFTEAFETDDFESDFPPFDFNFGFGASATAVSAIFDFGDFFFTLRFFADVGVSAATLSSSIPNIAPRSCESSPPLALPVSSRSRLPDAIA